MKKHKLINFFDGYKDGNKSNKNNRLYSIGIGIILLLIVIRIFTEVSSIKKLETYVDDNEIKNNSQIEKIQEKEVKLDQIKKVYELIGADNITKLSADSSYINIEGSCTDLQVLEKVKNENYIKDISVNNIRKENNNYIFNLRYVR